MKILKDIYQKVCFKLLTIIYIMIFSLSARGETYVADNQNAAKSKKDAIVTIGDKNIDKKRLCKK